MVAIYRAWWEGRRVSSERRLNTARDRAGQDLARQGGLGDVSGQNRTGKDILRTPTVATHRNIVLNMLKLRIL